jgi:hypothetical protein
MMQQFIFIKIQFPVRCPVDIRYFVQLTVLIYADGVKELTKHK